MKRVPKDRQWQKLSRRNLIDKIKEVLGHGGQVVVMVPTKRLSENLTLCMLQNGIRARYFHAEIEPPSRKRILKEFVAGECQVLIGVNLLRKACVNFWINLVETEQSMVV